MEKFQTIKISASNFQERRAFWEDFYEQMMRVRVLEEQLIGLWKKGMGFFWTGGPGEEAVQVSLAKLLQLGEGPAFDFFHPHYRNTGVVLAAGEPMLSSIRQMRSLKTDPYSGGRNFVSHSAIKHKNVIPVSSPLATQCLLGVGTAMAQRRERLKTGAKSISVVVIGEASSASPDFASSMIWSSRPNLELPLLTVITNNAYGISTPTHTQLSAIATRAKAFGVSVVQVDGIDAPSAFESLKNAVERVRETGRPFVIELSVSRLYGHSSSSGANIKPEERCPLHELEKRLIQSGTSKSFFAECREKALREFQEALELTKGEQMPLPEEFLHYSFCEKAEGGLPTL